MPRINKEYAAQAAKGAVWLNYGLDPLQLLRKSENSFSLADCTSAKELQAQAEASVIDYLASLLSASDIGNEHGVTH